MAPEHDHAPVDPETAAPGPLVPEGAAAPVEPLGETSTPPDTEETSPWAPPPDASEETSPWAPPPAAAEPSASPWSSPSGGSSGSGGTATTSSWPAAAPTAEEPAVDAQSIPPAWPAPPAPPTAASAPAKAPSTRRAALMGALAGAVVAALVSTVVVVALDDDDSDDRSSAPVGTPILTNEGGLDIQGILDKVQPSVVAIQTSQTTSRGVAEGAGSGIVLSADGLVLTNAHVIGNAGDTTVVLADGTEHPADLVGASPDDDVAVIRVQGVDDLVPAELGSSDDLRVGDEVIAIGNALNLGGEPTVTRGIVSAKDRDLEAEGVSLEGLIQTDAAINPGNSGGPLVNSGGQVVGMNTAIVAEAQNLGFSIAIDRAQPIIDDLEAGRGSITPGQAFLGVSSADIDSLTDLDKRELGVDRETGAVVTEVVPGTAAADGGLEIGDVIIEIDGEPVETSEDVREQIIAHEPEDEIEVRVVRAGEEQVLTVTLGSRGDGT